MRYLIDRNKWSHLLTYTYLFLQLSHFIPFTRSIRYIYVFLLTSLQDYGLYLFNDHLLASAWKWKKLISALIDWLYHFFFLLHFLSWIYRTFYIDFLSFQFNNKMIILWDSIDIGKNCFKFSINWFKMHPSKWKKLNLLDFALWFLEFNMYFIFNNQKIFIDCFDKFDYLFWSTQLYIDKNIFIFCKLNSCVFLNSWPHENLLKDLIINFIV